MFNILTEMKVYGFNSFLLSKVLDVTSYFLLTRCILLVITLKKNVSVNNLFKLTASQENIIRMMSSSWFFLLTYMCNEYIYICNGNSATQTRHDYLDMHKLHTSVLVRHVSNIRKCFFVLKFSEY